MITICCRKILTDISHLPLQKVSIILQWVYPVKKKIHIQRLRRPSRFIWSIRVVWTNRYILSKMNESVHIDNHGLYRGDILMCIPAKIMINDIIRTRLFKILKNLGFTLKLNLIWKIFQFLDVDFILSAGTDSSYLKLNINLKHINSKSKLLDKCD